jgi:asparagine synthase (glutamine-hydrolysing)
MCGIAGFLGAGNEPGGSMDAVLGSMTGALVHRGPDGHGSWVDPESGIALGHRRLSIVDLSPLGRQPMASGSGRYVISFNGEIYNFTDLRAELEASGQRFRGHSDTEVMLAAIDMWGVAAALRKFSGMFAFALWDKRQRQLTLARDRLGEKPLYYGWCRGIFLFASELKAMRAHPRWQGEVDPDSLSLFMRLAYIPSPHSIFKGIRKLPPGTLLTIQAGEGESQPREPEPYWTARQAAEAGCAAPFRGGDQEAIGEFDRLLRESIRRQMVADVPLGAFLSGGIDSSAIVALMQAQGSRPVKTFTIGFNEKRFNEAAFAKKVASHLGTDHTELYLDPGDALRVIPKLPEYYDEPFADPSQIPTFLLAEMTRRHVTVSLSGDGGDELLGGYPRYRLFSEFQRLRPALAGPLGRGAAALALKLPPRALKSFFSAFNPLLPRRLRGRDFGDKLLKVADILAARDVEEMYVRSVSHWKQPARLVLGASEPETLFTGRRDWPALGSLSHAMMYVDMMTYLPDDVLVKVDRAGMAVSLETRMPFLDHRLVEFCWSLPLSMKIRQGKGKWILREMLHKYVPREYFDRPKMGFSIPLAAWLRGPLREWGEALLEKGKLAQSGYLNPMLVRKKWEEHVSGVRNWHFPLWNVLMFQAWLEKQPADAPRTAGHPEPVQSGLP